MQKKTIFIILGIVVVLAAGVWYGARVVRVPFSSPAPVSVNREGGVPLGPTDKAPNIRASGFVEGPDGARVRVELFAADERIESQEEDSCFAKKGEKIYRGTYSLATDSAHATATIEVGQLAFREGEPEGDALWIAALDPGGHKHFVVVPQYASCNGMRAKVYGYDFARREFAPYRFAFIDGTKSEAFVGNESIERSFVLSSEGTFLTIGYDNSFGRTVYFKWRADPEKGAFEEFGAWTDDR
jgi:hypothetical protein